MKLLYRSSLSKFIFVCKPLCLVRCLLRDDVILYQKSNLSLF
nr:MAG TPA: hypothetical protein [Caudoviricetes sp.]